MIVPLEELCPEIVGREEQVFSDHTRAQLNNASH